MTTHRNVPARFCQQAYSFSHICRNLHASASAGKQHCTKRNNV